MHNVTKIRFAAKIFLIKTFCFYKDFPELAWLYEFFETTRENASHSSASQTSPTYDLLRGAAWMKFSFVLRLLLARNERIDNHWPGVLSLFVSSRGLVNNGCNVGEEAFVFKRFVTFEKSESDGYSVHHDVSFINNYVKLSLDFQLNFCLIIVAQTFVSCSLHFPLMFSF